MKTSHNKYIPFWVFTIAAMLAVTLPVLIQDGMFCDGVLYTCVARNMSMNYGTFWFPKYNSLGISGVATFHEQPPLVFGIQAIFFKLFGDTIYIERCLVMVDYIISALLIVKIWRLEFDMEPAIKKLSWIPLLLWCAIPIVAWSFQNNMMENTMGIFCLSSAYCTMYFLKNKSKHFIWIIISGITIFFAVFSKGLPGLFTIMIPLLYWFVYRSYNFKKALFYTLVLISIPTVIFSFLLLFAEPRKSLTLYFFEHLLMRVHTMPTANYRLESIIRLFTELIPVYCICFIVLFIVYLNSKQLHIKNYLTERFAFYLLLGLSGAVPLVMTMVQKGFYLIPCLPFFAIGFATLLAPHTSGWLGLLKENTHGFKIFNAFSYLILLSVILFSCMQIGKVSRQEDLVYDTHLLNGYFTKFGVVSVPENLYNEYDFVLSGYLMRNAYTSIDPFKQYKYCITFTGEPVPDTNLYRKVIINTKKILLYERK